MVKKSSRKMTEGVPDFSVIHKGNLKGFVSICPGWGGIDGSALLEICQEVYEEEELEELNHKIRIWSGEERGKVVSMLKGYIMDRANIDRRYRASSYDTLKEVEKIAMEKKRA